MDKLLNYSISSDINEYKSWKNRIQLLNYKRDKLSKSQEHYKILSFPEFLSWQPTILKMSKVIKIINQFFNDHLKCDYELNDSQTDFKSSWNKTLIFKNKKNESVSINQLSSGEKNIVSRAIQILADKQYFEGGLKVLVDEPETSLHLNWEKKIFSFYWNLLTKYDFSANYKNEKFMEKPSYYYQLFISTHSVNVINDALQNASENTLIFNITKNNKCKASLISQDNFNKNDGITVAEIIYRVFGEITIDYHLQLYTKIMEIANARSQKKLISLFVIVMEFI